MGKATWANKQTETLRKMWCAGLTCREIAITFGLSRSAISGKLMRMGLRDRTPERLANVIKRKQAILDELQGAA